MPSNKPTPSHDLLTLYDDFAELDACYAFFCDAVAALNSNREEALDDASAEGLRVFCQWLKEKSTTFKVDLNAAWRAASAGERH